MSKGTPLPVREWQSDGTDPALVFARLLRANALVAACLRVRFADAGLPPFELARLMWLWSEHNIALEVRDIATKLGLSRAATSRLVDRAQSAGLIERSPGVLDAREVTVQVTTLGRAAIHRFDAALRGLAREIELDDDELHRLAELVDRIVRRYERS